HEVTTDVCEKHRMVGCVLCRRRSLHGMHLSSVLSVIAIWQLDFCFASSETRRSRRHSVFEAIPYRAKRARAPFQNRQGNVVRCKSCFNSKKHLPRFTGGGSGRIADDVEPNEALTKNRRQAGGPSEASDGDRCVARSLP